MPLPPWAPSLLCVAPIPPPPPPPLQRGALGSTQSWGRGCGGCHAGTQIGDNNTETGYLRLDCVRIPRTWMLMKNQEVQPGDPPLPRRPLSIFDAPHATPRARAPPHPPCSSPSPAFSPTPPHPVPPHRHTTHPSATGTALPRLSASLSRDPAIPPPQPHQMGRTSKRPVALAAVAMARLSTAPCLPSARRWSWARGTPWREVSQ